MKRKREKQKDQKAYEVGLAVIERFTSLRKRRDRNPLILRERLESAAFALAQLVLDLLSPRQKLDIVRRIDEAIEKAWENDPSTLVAIEAGDEMQIFRAAAKAHPENGRPKKVQTIKRHHGRRRHTRRTDRHEMRA